jgi:hypothetical protein
MRLGLYLAEKTHPLVVMVGAQLLAALCTLISSYMPTMWTFILWYGIVFGLFAGQNFILVMHECNKYLVGKKMYVNGLILVGTGMGPAVWG